MPKHSIEEMDKNTETGLEIVGSLLTAIVIAGTAAGVNAKKKKELEQQIQYCRDQINALEVRINQEKEKGWLMRDDNLINNLRARQSEYIEQYNQLQDQYKQK